MKKKHKDLQPWLDYFNMLRRHEEQGFLYVKAQEHEAYVTQPALHAMTPGDDPVEQVQSGAVLTTLHHIRAYCACQHAHTLGLSTYDPKAAPDAPLANIPVKTLRQYERQPFALHVVQPDVPHDLIYTILVTPRRHLWRWREEVEVINYNEVKNEE